MFTKQLVAPTLCVLPVIATPSPLVTVKKAKKAVAGHYIVTFKNNVVHSAGVSSVTGAISSHSRVTHEWGIINGFAGVFTDADLEVWGLTPTSRPSIRMPSFTPRPVPPSKHLQSSDHSGILTHPIRTNAPWGLGRVNPQTKLTDQDVDALTYTYKYDSTAGANSDVYILGTCVEGSTC